MSLNSAMKFKSGFLDRLVGQESACNAGDPGLILGSERSNGQGISFPFPYSWASLVAQLIKNLPARRHQFDPWIGEIPGERKGYPLQYSGLENSMDCIGLQRAGHD